LLQERRQDGNLNFIGLLTTRPQESMVKMKVGGGQPMIFMVDSGAEHSVVTKPVAPLTWHRATIVGTTGTQTTWPFFQPGHAN
jgi:hypothetical protein